MVGCLFFLNDPAPPEIYTLSPPAALPIPQASARRPPPGPPASSGRASRQGRSSSATSPARPPSSSWTRSEEHTSELQSRQYLVCRLLLEKKKTLFWFTHINLLPRR